jgi:hypothetical protein
MRIYFLRTNPDKYQFFVPSQDNTLHIIRQFDGTPIGSSWLPLEVEQCEDDNIEPLQPCDFPSFKRHIPVFSKHAVDTLKDILTENGEILPLKCDEGVYYAYNVTCVADVLDHEKSEIKRFESSGRIMRIVRHKFLIEQLSGLVIFKIPEVPDMDVFVTEAFIQRVQEAGLTGFEFEVAWSSSED